MSGDLNIALILKLVDQVTAPARAIQGALRGIGQQTTALGQNGVNWANQQLAANQARKAALRGEALGLGLLGLPWQICSNQQSHLKNPWRVSQKL